MILVTGGTGLVGSHLLYFLLQSNDKIRATHREHSTFIAVKEVFSYYEENVETLFNKIEWIQADLTNIPDLTIAFKDVKYVYHAAAYISFNPRDYYKLKKSNIEGTANVVNLCLSEGVDKLCYVSSIATLGKTLDNSPITESTSWNPEAANSVYGITKFGAEMEVWRASQEGLDVVIVNPSIVLGSGHWHSGSGKIISEGTKGLRFYTTGSNGFVDVQDLVKIMITLMDSEIKNQQFIVSGENIKYQKLFNLIAKESKVNPPYISVPKWILVILVFFDSISKLLFGTKRKLFRSTVNSLYIDSEYSSRKIQEALSFNFTPLPSTINRLVKNYKKSI